MTTWLALLLLVVAGFVLVLWHDAGSIAGLDPAAFAGLMSSAALLVFYGGSLLSARSGRLTQALRDLATWALIGLVLVGVYSYRGELSEVGNRIMAELAPAGVDVGGAVSAPGERAVRIRRQSDGHFVARVIVDGAAMPMLVDTGASSVVLRPADAERIGIDTSTLAYAVPVSTANGTAFAARARIKSLTLGAIVISDVEVLVAQPGALSDNLLGMTFLSRLKSYEFSGDYLTLRG
jgi:aspartyl protease family protein